MVVLDYVYKNEMKEVIQTEKEVIEEITPWFIFIIVFGGLMIWLLIYLSFR